MARDKITGEPKAINCSVCGEYIPQSEAADILGQDVCPECEKQIMALAQYVMLQVPVNICDYRLETKDPDG